LTQGLLIPFDDDVTQFLDDYGHVRLANVRSSGLDWDGDRDRHLIMELYHKWVEQDEFIQLERTEEMNMGYYWDVRKRYVWVKACKRGNDIANRILATKMKKVKNILSGYDPNPDGVHTNMLFITLTWDTKICGRSEAWRSVGDEWNRFISNLNNLYGGNVKFVRSWESFSNGYPHIHALIYFPNWKFPYLRHNDGTYRLPYEQKDYIDHLWHSHVDVIAMTKKDISARLKDVLSYVVKFEDSHVPYDQWNDKEKLTITALWFFGLKQYGISHEWFDLTTTVRVIQKLTCQLDLEGNVISTVSYRFVGIISGADCKTGGDTWYKSSKDMPIWWSLGWIPKNMKTVRSQLRDMGFA